MYSQGYIPPNQQPQRSRRRTARQPQMQQVPMQQVQMQQIQQPPMRSMPMQQVPMQQPPQQIPQPHPQPRQQVQPPQGWYSQQNQQSWYAPGPVQPPQKQSGGEKEKDGSDKPKKKASLKWQLIKILIVVVIFAAIGIGGYYWRTQNAVEPYKNVFLPNVYVDGICLAGMTWEEGSVAVYEQANTKKTGWYVRLKNTSGEYKDITADMLGISFDPSQALAQAWSIGHNVDPNQPKDMFQLNAEIDLAKTTTYEFSSAEISANTAPIDTILSTLQQAAYRPAQDAVLLSFNPDDMYEPFSFQPEVYGQYLDITVVKEKILEMVHTFTSGEILLELTPIQPNVTVAMLQENVSLRYRAVTPIASDSTPERTANIEVAFSKINGMRIPNGKKFSFNTVVGNRNEKNGFHQAIEYAYGQEVLGWGGGVCQASTTVYLAAVQSGLKINHREAHSNPVSYTQMGMDATVSDTRGRKIDFTFTNDTGGDIYIAAHVITSSANSKRLQCEVRIYGPSLQNVSYMLESQTVEVLPKPVEPELKPDETAQFVIFDDEKKKYSSGRDGYVVDTYLITLVDGQEVDRKKLHQDTYPARPDRYWVGITPRY